MINESIRINMDTLEISLSSENFLCDLFGATMRNNPKKMKQRNWEKILKKITSGLKKSIAKNLNSNEFHKCRLYLHLDQLDEACKSKNNTDPEFILSLTGIIFELLGRTPNYSGRRRLNRKDDFKLNNLRSICYLQTPFQKVETIFEASRYPPYNDQHSYEELFQKYMTKYNGKPKRFLEWYKEQYPKVYSKIF